MAITANTSYIASYHTDAGHYAFDPQTFTASLNNPPLRALQDGFDGANGVARYGPSSFPDLTYQSTNYWVDVVFNLTPNP